jgi:DNA polymerase-4
MGFFVITPMMGPVFVEDLKVGKFHGVGPLKAAKMNGLRIHTGLDLRAQSFAFLKDHFSKSSSCYYGLAHGTDDCPVEADRLRKSVGAETIFARNLAAWEEVAPALGTVFAKVWAACLRGGYAGRTVTVKVKYGDFRQSTRRRSFLEPVAPQLDLERIGLKLLRPWFPPHRSVRMLGVTLSSLAPLASKSQASWRFAWTILVQLFPRPRHLTS